MKRLSFLLVTLVACGGTQDAVNQPTVAGPGSAPAPRPVASGDVSFEVPALPIQGTVFEPEALGRPDMPLYDPKRPIALDKQRTLVQRAKDPVQKQAQAAVLATLLYRESKKNKDKEKDLLTDARQVLRDVAQQAGDKAIDEVTLRLLGSYELLVDDYPAAEKAWRTLIEKDPKSKELAYHRAWLVYALLKQFKNAEALAAVGTEAIDDKHPELAYVAAWARLRTNDGAGAWQAIIAAAKGWGQGANREGLEKEVLLFAARTKVPFDQAVTPLTTVLAKAEVQQYELLARLGLYSYGGSGRWADAVTALDKAATLASGVAPPGDRMVIRYQQAFFLVCLDTPEVAARYAKQAVDAAAACGDKCSAKDKADTVQLVFNNIGRLFHNLYATANDRRYYQPAHDIYAATIPLLGAAARADAQKVSDLLEKSFKSLKPGKGTHDKSNVEILLGRHSAEVQACYEAALGANPKLGGTLTLSIEADDTGAIKGATTEPAAGLTDLPAVAACVLEQARQWKLPRRGMAGNTRIKLSYTLSVKN